MKRGNLARGIPAPLVDEWVEGIAGTSRVRIERIVSRGHVSPPGFWYEQAEHEYVLLLQGRAVVEFEGTESVTLGPGDWIEIPAKARHRVGFTAPQDDTIWLAVFYEAEG